MRGIGRGQTVCLLVPPEVACLVRAELGPGRPPLRPGSDEAGLCAVAAWLLANGARSERVQADMLVCQVRAGPERRGRVRGVGRRAGWPACR